MSSRSRPGPSAGTPGGPGRPARPRETGSGETGSGGTGSRGPRADQRAAASGGTLERGRARALLGGLLAFTAGFAAAGAARLISRAGLAGDLGLSGHLGQVYLVGVSLGLVGIGLTGFFYHRGAAALPQARLWSAQLIRAVAASAGLPAVPAVAVLWTLGVLGVVGNIVVPLTRR